MPSAMERQGHFAKTHVFSKEQYQTLLEDARQGPAFTKTKSERAAGGRASAVGAAAGQRLAACVYAGEDGAAQQQQLACLECLPHMVVPMPEQSLQTPKPPLQPQPPQAPALGRRRRPTPFSVALCRRSKRKVTYSAACVCVCHNSLCSCHHYGTLPKGCQPGL